MCNVLIGQTLLQQTQGIVLSISNAQCRQHLDVFLERRRCRLGRQTMAHPGTQHGEEDGDQCDIDLRRKQPRGVPILQPREQEGGRRDANTVIQAEANEVHA